MGSDFGGSCGYEGDYGGGRCEESGVVPVKILGDPLVTPDGRWHWKVKRIVYKCPKHAREGFIKGSTVSEGVSYDELEDRLEDEAYQVNLSPRDAEKQSVKLIESREFESNVERPDYCPNCESKEEFGNWDVGTWYCNGCGVYVEWVGDEWELVDLDNENADWDSVKENVEGDLNED